MIQFLVILPILGDQALQVLMDRQVQRDFQVLGAFRDGGVWMGKKVGVASQENQKCPVHQVFVVPRETQVLVVKRGPPLLGPQALLGHRE